MDNLDMGHKGNRKPGPAVVAAHMKVRESQKQHL